MWEIIIAPWGQKFQARAGTHTCKIRKFGMKKESIVKRMGSWSKNFLWKMKLPLAEGNHRTKRKGTPVQGSAGGSGRETCLPLLAPQGSQTSTPRRGQHVATGWPETCTLAVLIACPHIPRQLAPQLPSHCRAGQKVPASELLPPGWPALLGELALAERPVG